MLADLADVLTEVRRRPGIVEKKPGVFYVGREPFLHFHLLAQGKRRVDVEGRTEWIQIDFPRPASASRQLRLRRGLRKQYAAKPNGVAGRGPRGGGRAIGKRIADR